MARRLFGSSRETMDYERICTTVFTPLEYACCGLSEEDAVERFGDEDIEVFHSPFKPLEQVLVAADSANTGYCKAVCHVSDGNRIVGLHFLGPHAGEVLQGFGVAMNMGMTLDDLQRTVGIHPTVAEEVVNLHISKRSGVVADLTGC